MNIRHVSLGILIGALLVGCAGMSYKYYGLEAKSYEGRLLGPGPKDDLDFMVCAPGAQVKHPCVVLKADEFFNLKQDYLETKQALKDCQSGK